MTHFDDPTMRRLFVFSHPNHELAVFGLVQRLRPNFLYLTDGGGGKRVAETRHGLQSVGLLDRARFLDYSERAFYGALLQRDVRFCENVAAAIRRETDALQAEQVFCDAVEFYNPVHDLTLPLVLHALRGKSGVSVFELPLVYQSVGPHETYQVQRFPLSRQEEQVMLELTKTELAAKTRSWGEIYRQLRGQMQPITDRLPANHAAREVFRPAPGVLPEPDAERVLRYEWRGHLHLARGAIDEVITYADHYRPLTSRLSGIIRSQP